MIRSKEYSRQSLGPRAFNYSLLVVLAAVIVFPIYWMVVTSVAPEGTAGVVPNFRTATMHNYASVLTGKDFGFWYLNTVVVAVITTTVSVVISILSAYAIARYSFRGRSLFGIVVMLIQLLPEILVGLPLYAILHRLGLLNSYVGLSAAYVTRALPYCTWFLWGYFQQLPAELEEAAFIDGAGRFDVIYRIILPLSWQGIAVATMFTFVLVWQEYFLALLIMTKQVFLTLTVGAARLVNGEVVHEGDLMAYSVLMTIPVAVVFGFVQRYMVQGMSAGAVKG